MIKNTLTLLALFLTLSHVWAQATPPKSIALSEFRGHQITEVQLELFTNQLRTALVQQGHFSVVERERVDLVLQEQGFSQSGSTQEAIKLGALLKVDYILTGSFAQSSGRFYATVDLVNTQTGQIEHSTKVQGKSGQEDFIHHKIDLLARKIADPNYTLIFSPLKTAAWIGSGIALAQLGIGFYFENQAQASFREFENNPNNANLSTLRDQQNYRNYAYAGALAFATTSLILWFWPDSPSPHSPQPTTALNVYFEPSLINSRGDTWQIQWKGRF